MSLKRQTAWSMAPLLVVSVVNFFSVPLLLKSLGADLFALSLYISTFSGMFGFADLGLGVAVGRYVGMAIGNGDQTAVREYWGTGNLIALPLLAVMALAFAGLGVVFGPMWFNVSPEDAGMMRACFLFGGLGLFLSCYAQIWNILLQAHLNFKFSSVMRVGISLLQVIPMVIIAWQTQSVLWMTIWGVAINGLQLMVLMWYVRRSYGMGPCLKSARRARLNEMAAYTATTFLSLIVGSLFAAIDRVVLGKFASTTGFGYYGIGSNVANRVQGLGSAVMGPAFHNTNRAAGTKHQASATGIFNEMFDFTFGWYLLVTIWVACWHPFLLRLWLGEEAGRGVEPLITPIVAAACLTGLTGLSVSQLCSLGRVGTTVAFAASAGVAAAAGVWIGWHLGGLAGAAYGFLLSRLAYVAQDLFAMRLLKADGWFSSRTWLGIFGQCAVGGAFALSYFVCPRYSLWLLVPALLHGFGVAAWLLRHPLGRISANFNRWWSAGRPPEKFLSTL